MGLEAKRSLSKKMEGADEGGIERVVDSKDLQQQSKALDKLTDRVEDRQLYTHNHILRHNKIKI